MKVLSAAYRWTWLDWLCLWYPPGWLILFNRHWQHYHADPQGWRSWEYGLFLIPGGFYLALLIRWLRLGCRLPCIEPHEFNPAYQRAFRDEILDPILKHYFHAELHQIEHLPETGPVLIVLNHAGMCMPWDFLGLGVLLSQASNWPVQPLAHHAVFDHPWITWWLPPGWTQTLGGVPADHQNFEAALAAKRILLYAPEGLRGPRKGWRQRYQVATFDPSFIRLSTRHQIPILPVICLGNESLHPWAFNLRQLAARLHLPFLPLSPLMPLFVLFPSMGVWAMRSHLRYSLLPVWRLWQTQAADPPQPRSAAYHQAQDLRAQLQTALTRALAQTPTLPPKA